MLALAALTFFTSCSSDDDINEIPEETGDYANGIFVLNEGVFGNGNSTISFIDENMDSISHNIFYETNSGEALGDTGQSMNFYEDYAFIVVNVSNKIEVVDRYTFESIATIDEGLINPRYLTFNGGNAFVTNWGDGGDPDDDYIAVINLETLEIEENIAVAEGPEEILSEGTNLYVSHQGGWSFNNKVSVINVNDYNISELTVGDVPNSMIVEEGFLWVASSGFPSYSDEETAGKIQKIDLASNEIVQEYEFDAPTNHPGNLQIENGTVYYTMGGNVYAFSSSETTLPDSVFLELSEVNSLYGFNVNDGFIYAASSSTTNTGNGNLYIYDAASGSLVTSFETGINPNGVYFND